MQRRILIVRLGSMGDILHAMPAVASVRLAYPEAHIAWAVQPRWLPLLAGYPHIDEAIPVERKTLRGVLAARSRLREKPFDLAIDFQGLVQSALVARASRAAAIFGFGRASLKEKAASVFYSATVTPRATHIVDMNLELAGKAGAPVTRIEFAVPAGRPEGALPQGPFVLASPLAGWASKQWPAESFSTLAARLNAEAGMPLVVNGPPESAPLLLRIEGAKPHVSGLEGLIDATRRATAVVGVDSGPMHLAAALGKPGVALFGPTDPARNGPYAKSFVVLRDPSAKTTYKRGQQIAESMRALTAEMVWQALAGRLAETAPR